MVGFLALAIFNETHRHCDFYQIEYYTHYAIIGHYVIELPLSVKVHKS